MFGLGFSEILVIVVVALVLFGPKQFLEILRKVRNLHTVLDREWQSLRDAFLGEQEEERDAPFGSPAFLERAERLLEPREQNSPQKDAPHEPKRPS